MILRIAASLASAPLDQLGKVVSELEQERVDEIHFDVEDGTFVPVMTLGTKIIADLRPLTHLLFDAHLMVTHPEWILTEVVRNGANRVSVHYEAMDYPRRTLSKIVSLGAQAGIALNPATPLPDLTYLLPYLSYVVILTTEPEIGCSPFLEEMLRKVHAGKNIPGLTNLEWVVDGGACPENIQKIAASGVDKVVVGRAIFKDGRIKENIAALRSAMKR